jgi:cytochrome c oxidase assembly protein subunit 11
MSQTVPSDLPPPQAVVGGVAAAKRNARMALILLGMFVFMVGAAYAAVPIYKAFCQATGFGGTVRKAEVAPATVLSRTLNVRFDTNVRSLPWDFTADEVSQTIKIGQTGMAFFRVTNHGDKPYTGRAIYNVVPEVAGAYFQKLECFCFSDQTIQPGQTVEFPVVYFVDPAYVNDYDARTKDEITLSYTFFPSTDAAPAPATGGSVKQTSTLKPLAASPPLGGSAKARL